MQTNLIVTAPIAGSLSAGSLLHLWARSDRTLLSRRLWWSVVVLVPVAGPLFYGAMYRSLPAHNYRGEGEKYSSPYDFAEGENYPPDR